MKAYKTFLLIFLFLLSSLSAAAAKQPNIVLILADDLGFSDTAPYGGEIPTPNISQLANEGLMFTNYHTAASCAPTRGMLMTGVDSHRNGVPNMPEALPASMGEHENYRGVLGRNVVTIAERLRDAGYHTYMSGKWHLGREPDQLPSSRGFERTVTMTDTGADNWEQKTYLPLYTTPHWFADGKEIDLPEDFYSSKFFVDHMINFIDSNQGDEKPFFAYLAFLAVHIPVQAPQEFTDKYMGDYDAGWHELRKKRLEMAKKLKVVPETTTLADVPGVVDWDSLSEEEKRYESKKMAVYAGMIDAMDHHIGRLITYLKETGQYNNTVFVFTSDNGAEGGDAWDRSLDVTPIDKLFLKLWMKNNGYNLDYENLGTRGSYVNIGPSLASAAASPLTFYKFFAHEGGMRVPLIMSGPGVTEAGRMSSAFSFVTDIAPTLLDIAGVDNPQNEYQGRTVEPMVGQSILPLVQGKTERVHAADKTIGYELGGNAALFQGDYKIVMDRGPVADGQWHLYNIVTDPGETRDLKEAMPQRFSAMMAAYQKYVVDNNVRPVSDDYDQKKQLGINMAITQLKSGSPNLYTLIAVLILLLGLVAYQIRNLVKRHRNRKWYNRMQPDPPKPGGAEGIVARTPKNGSSVSDPQAPYSLFKMDISYFSGKLEAYLRYKGVPHIPIEADNAKMEMIHAATGVQKVPAVRTADGKWLFDTTPMIGWFEEKYTAAPVLPTDDAALAFVALLIEDYGDEWLWRPAMWWRWVARASRWALGWRIAATNIPKAPSRLLGWYFGRRQLKEWLWNDGVTRDNSHSVRDMLFRELEFLEPLLEEQPFILGSHPSTADFGYFGSMFRHFGNDPDSAEVMRQQAPNTYEWLARLWNLRIDKCPAEQAWTWPEADYWGPLLSRIAKDYLPYLHQNALAHQDGKKTFDYRGATLELRNTITTTYRVWCREVLQERYLALSDSDRQRVSALFAPHGGLDALFADGTIASGLADHFRLPLDPEVSGSFKQSLKIKLLGQARN